ncbi:glycosyl hydrolase family 18 protein [Candidatus Merdisoma sp. JLR.KK006]|uniref:glycosyl hydrolase family 18 protein n=1 Tax=Candidatus Merdisoma sp. JLR.KK006 TaxID=3112626 RepID=UPI002FF0FBEE
MEIYIVQPGDTPQSIAALYGVSPQRLIYDNQLAELPYLPAGMAVLVLIPALIHTVSEGETPEEIAAAYGLTQRQLYQNNPYLLEQPYLRTGQSLVIRYQGQEDNGLYVTGYAYPFIEEEVLREALLYLDELLIFSYGFTTAGALIPPQIPENRMISLAWQMGVRPILVLTPFSEQGNFNNQLVKAVSEDLEMQQVLIGNLLETVRELGYAGVDVDFEYILPEDRESYAAFVGNLREVMNREGYQVSVALAPKTSGEQRGLLYEGMDYALLGASANQVFLMTYEWGHQHGPAMAIAPINKVRQVLDYAVTEIPRNQILMGIPNYAYDWTLPFVQGESIAEIMGNVEAVRRAAIQGVPIQYDETAQSPWYAYEQYGITHEVWFEDVRSMEVKLRTVIEYGFLGIGYWNLMRNFRANWLLLQMLSGRS